MYRSIRGIIGLAGRRLDGLLEGTLKSVQTLRARLPDAGVASDAPIVTHCDARGRAALAALAAVVAGQRDVSTYYLSFSDWAADDSCPVVQT